MASRADWLHTVAQANLQDAVATTLKRLAQTAPLERTAAERAAYAAATARIVSAGQLQAAKLALAYIGAYVAPVRAPNLERVLADKLMTPDSPGAFVGLLRTWSRLDDGADEQDARAEGGSFAADLAEGDMKAAQRAGLDEAADAADTEPRWAKLPKPDACAWCRLVSGIDAGGNPYRYLSAETIPFHGSCKCGAAPQFSDGEIEVDEVG